MSFTDGTPQIATAEHLALKWGGLSAREYFRCRMCGHTFAEGDGWRFVFTNNLEGRYCGNPLVCAACDGPDVIERWKALCEEWHAVMNSPRFWWWKMVAGRR